ADGRSPSIVLPQLAVPDRSWETGRSRAAAQHRSDDMKTRMIAIVLASLPFAAAADGFDYTFVEAGYVESELDVGAGDVDGDGLGVGAGLRFRATDKVELDGMIRYVDLDES